jgi:hypothetical protein
MGIFTHEIVLLDIPIKKMLRTQNEDLTFLRGHIHFSGANDPAEFVSAGPVYLKGQCSWLFASFIFISWSP